ncbi:unnamed protein product, partial [Mesorhabditis belari]|uniref:C-type lectin domain-containing protein n=1 Tax=Mesorhabditis belari TaxID=2138241 RepID=A0AAF3F1I1_9BILA
MNGSWTYADGTPLGYQNWASNEPNNTNNATCAKMYGGTGQWFSSRCGANAPVLCTISEANQLKCPQNWTYYTDHCYYRQNSTYHTNGSYALYSFVEAEQECQKLGAHLASIHSNDENLFLLRLATDFHWIGYRGNGTLGTGNWTDGSKDDFFGGNICGLNTGGGWNWHDYDRDSIARDSSFFCKKRSNQLRK